MSCWTWFGTGVSTIPKAATKKVAKEVTKKVVKKVVESAA